MVTKRDWWTAPTENHRQPMQARRQYLHPSPVKSLHETTQIVTSSLLFRNQVNIRARLAEELLINHPEVILFLSHAPIVALATGLNNDSHCPDPFFVLFLSLLALLLHRLVPRVTLFLCPFFCSTHRFTDLTVHHSSLLSYFCPCTLIFLPLDGPTSLICTHCRTNGF